MPVAIRRDVLERAHIAQILALYEWRVIRPECDLPQEDFWTQGRSRACQVGRYVPVVLTAPLVDFPRPQNGSDTLRLGAHQTERAAAQADRGPSTDASVYRAVPRTHNAAEDETFAWRTDR